MGLDTLIERISNITTESLFGGEVTLFSVAKEFFSREEIQEKMIELNQNQLYYKTADRNGNLHNHYAPRTAKHKRRVGLPDERYTFRETGRFYDSLEVFVDDDYVFIPWPTNQDYFEPLLTNYATENDLGLTDEDLLSLMPELKDSAIRRLKDYISNG